MAVKRLTTIALAFVLAVIVVGSVAFTVAYVGPEEQPPCHACKQVENEKRVTSICEMMQVPDQFAGQNVRVQGRLRNDAAQLSIEDSGCTMHLGFAKGWQTCAGAWKKLQITCGVNTWYDGEADVKLTGVLATIPEGNYYAGDKGLVVSCLEAVQTKPTLTDRIKYALGRLF